MGIHSATFCAIKHCAQSPHRGSMLCSAHGGGGPCDRGIIRSSDTPDDLVRLRAALRDLFPEPAGCALATHPSRVPSPDPDAILKQIVDACTSCGLPITNTGGASLPDWRTHEASGGQMNTYHGMLFELTDRLLDGRGIYEERDASHSHKWIWVDYGGWAESKDRRYRQFEDTPPPGMPDVYLLWGPPATAEWRIVGSTFLLCNGILRQKVDLELPFAYCEALQSVSFSKVFPLEREDRIASSAWFLRSKGWVVKPCDAERRAIARNGSLVCSSVTDSGRAHSPDPHEFFCGVPKHLCPTPTSWMCKCHGSGS